MKLLKNVLIISLVTLIISCKSGLEKNYDKASKIEDLKEIATIISNQDLAILEGYIIEKEANGYTLSNTTYNDLLIEGREKDFERQEIRREEEWKEEKRIKAEDLKKAVIAKKELLCNKKWKINEYAMLISIPDDSTENIETGTDILNRSTKFIKDAKLIISLLREGNRTFMKGTFDEKLTKVMSSNNKRTKEYFKDGTYKVSVGKDTETGTWEFVDTNRIREKRGGRSSFRSNTSATFFEVDKLDNTTFNFKKHEYSVLDYGKKPTTYTAIKMSL